MNESELLPRRKCEELFLAVEQAARRAGVTDIEISLTSTADSLTRFANNEIHQNVSERATSLSVRAIVDRRLRVPARIDCIAMAFKRWLMKRSPSRAPASRRNFSPLYEDPTICDGQHYSQAAAECTPAQRAAGVADAIRVVEAHGQIAAGIYSTAQNVEVLMNSRGMFRYYFDTLTQFSITAMAGDSSGWAKGTSSVHEDVWPVELAAHAARKGYSVPQSA